MVTTHITKLLLICFLFLRDGVIGLEFTNPSFRDIMPDTIFTLTWSGQTGLVTITLLNGGDPNNMQFYATIATDFEGRSYDWSVPRDLGTDVFQFKITDQTSTSLSPRVVIWGLDVFSSSNSTSASSLTQEPSVSSLPSSSSTPSTQTSSSTSSTTPPSSGGLSTGAKAGIGVGASLGFITILGAIFLAFRYGKKSAASKNTGSDRVEIGAGESKDGKGELADTGLVEAEGSKPLSEDEEKAMERRKRASELEGKSWTRPVEIG